MLPFAPGGNAASGASSALVVPRHAGFDPMFAQRDRPAGRSSCWSSSNSRHVISNARDLIKRMANRCCSLSWWIHRPMQAPLTCTAHWILRPDNVLVRSQPLRHCQPLPNSRAARDRAWVPGVPNLACQVLRDCWEVKRRWKSVCVWQRRP